jgi:hypothetical protein
LDILARAHRVAAHLGSISLLQLRLHDLREQIGAAVTGDDASPPPLRGHAALALPRLRHPLPAKGESGGVAGECVAVVIVVVV